MELNFDKEIDALLRQAARSGEIVSTITEAHLDADEIAAFAENALPEKIREFYIKHFADCDRCRTILSNTILLNQEAEAESASSAVAAPVATEIVETKIPWYRKLFLMPNLAYTMGGLVLIFGGMLGFLVLQNLNQTSSTDVARSTAEKSSEHAPSVSEDQSFSEPGLSSNTAANSANTMANAASTPFESNSITTNANSSVFAANSSSNSVLSSEPAKSEPADEMRDRKNEAATLNKENDFSIDGASGAENRALGKTAEEKSADVKTESVKQEDKPKIVATTPAKPSAQPPPPVVSKDDAEDSTKLSTAKRSAKREQTTKQVGGKTFNKVGGVWIDSAYNRYDGVTSNAQLPKTITIRRSSSEYRKLDKQVRIIAESLDGPVIIVWKDGAYRIQ